MRKSISLLLVFVVFITSVSVPMVSAEEAISECSVEVNYGGVLFRQNVVKNQDGQILAPVTWLNYFGGMKVDVEDGYYKFSYVGQEDMDSFAKRVMIKEDGSSFDVRYYIGMPKSLAGQPLKGNDLMRKIEQVNREMAAYVFEVQKQYYNLRQFGSEEGWSFSALSGTFSARAYYKECLYLPIAELLPLMNADVAFLEQGQVLIHPHSVSLSQALYGLNLDELRFVAVEDIRGSDFLSKTGYVIDTVLNFRIDRLDFIFQSGKLEDYQSLFKSYLADNEVYLSAFDAEQSPQSKQFAFMDEALGTGKTALGLLGTGFKWMESMGYSKEVFPDVYEVFFEDYPHTNIKGMDIVEGFGKCYSYVNTYANQVTDHRKMLAAVFDNSGADRDSVAYHAAQLTMDIYGEEYADKALGLVAEGIRDAAWKMTDDALISKTNPYVITAKVLKALLKDEFEVVKNTGLINYMDGMVEMAHSAFSSRSLTDCTANALNDLRLCAMMTLVASRHAYDTLWDGNHEKIQQIDAALTKLYLAAEGVDADSSDYYGKKKAELQDTVSRLSTKEGWKGEGQMETVTSTQISANLQSNISSTVATDGTYLYVVETDDEFQTYVNKYTVDKQHVATFGQVLAETIVYYEGNLIVCSMYTFTVMDTNGNVIRSFDVDDTLGNFCVQGGKIYYFKHNNVTSAWELCCVSLKGENKKNRQIAGFGFLYADAEFLYFYEWHVGTYGDRAYTIKKYDLKSNKVVEKENIVYSLSGGPNANGRAIACDGQKIYLWSDQFDGGEGVYALNMDLTNPIKMASGNAQAIQVCGGTLYVEIGDYIYSEVQTYDIATKKQKETITFPKEGSFNLEGVIGDYLCAYEETGYFSKTHLIEIG